MCETGGRGGGRWGSGWTRVTEDTLVTAQPCLVSGVVLTDANSRSVVVYAGQNAAGRRLFSLQTVAGAVSTVCVMFDPPLAVYGGLFVAPSATVTDGLVIWRPMGDMGAPEPAGGE